MPFYKEIDLLFIHIPKTGGTSIEDYLKKKYTQFVYGYFEFNASLQHQTYLDLIKSNELGIKFDNIITVVRNPYTRIISDLLSLFLIKTSSTPNEVNQVIKDYLNRTDLDNHNIPQYKFITNLDGKLIDCKIFRTETLTQDLKTLKVFDEYTGTEPKNYDSFLNENSINLINEFYKKDFEMFGYPMKSSISKKASICLNMIVKNEAEIIVETLKLLTDKIKFDYYVICDTGSTDTTVSLIKTFFDGKINGIIYNHTWKDFGYNRSLALECARGRCDYTFIFDADDYITGNLNLDRLVYDSYMLKFGDSSFSYERKCLVKSSLPWKYVGVLHEYIMCETNSSQGKIEGNYHIVSGRTSSRNKNKNKYIDDAKILENGFNESVISNDGLCDRYAYYCANSYKDAGKVSDAIHWYLKTLTLNGWFDEKYNSCLNLYNLLSDESKYYYLVESFNFNPKRVEGILELIKHYTIKGKYTIAWNYYLFIKDYYENEYYLSDGDLSVKLFAKVMDYTFYLPYFMIIVCEHLKKYQTGILMFKIIFKRKSKEGQWWIDNLFYNFQFYEKYIDSELEEMYIDYTEFLKKNNLNCKCQIKRKKKILFYTGFSAIPWNITFSENNALGGSERAVINLAQNLDYLITITGDVLYEKRGNITFKNRNDINFETSFFDIIVVSRYVSFFTLYPKYNCNKLYLMAHDTYLLNNLNGCNLTPNEIIKDVKIDGCVCLTKWHKEKYRNYNLNTVIINNGINLDLFRTLPKIANSFIYTSCQSRGLKRLLELWPEILKHLPDATLNVSSYEKIDIEPVKSVVFHGKLNQTSLYNLAAISEYWLYPCCFEETSCITAMEMLMSEVICLYYPIAGLTETMSDYGIQVTHGNEIETLLNLKDKTGIKARGKKYAESCSWKNRAAEWENLFTRRVFYAKDSFAKEMVEGYINSLSNAIYTTSYSDILEDDIVIFVYEVFDDRVKHYSFLNTEPLNLESRLNHVKSIKAKFIYDYSKSNITILNNNGIFNTKFLEYRYNQEEVDFLIEQKVIPIYDFGIICSAGLWTSDPDLIQPPRRHKVVKHLIASGFTVNIISGFSKERDIELGKCKTILNIHGELLNVTSGIFEHLRCNRLLYAGYNILSEESLFMDPEFIYPTLKFIGYDDFFKLKKRKIIDTFIFYNEVEMLNYRLKTLCNVVDYFVIVESTRTFMGKHKKLYFENDNRFKIIHVIVDDFEFTEPENGQQWINEAYQRNYIARGLAQIDLNEDDLIIISDVDEIPNPKILSTLQVETAVTLEQDFYYYNLNSKMDHLWYYSKIIKWGWYNGTPIQNIRTNNSFKIIPQGGWHLSYFGNAKFISNKIQNFSHSEYDLPEFTNELSISKKIENGTDLFNRNNKIIFIPLEQNPFLPPNYEELVHKELLIKQKRYCFIHSCTLNGTKRLDYLLERIKDIPFDNIFIINIGKEIEKGENYSPDTSLFEIPTINKMVQFSKENPNDIILYLHTKGVSYSDDYTEENDWIDMMLYFLLEVDNLENYDCMGCNYNTLPFPHFSGNFWWATTNYLKTLPMISEINVDKNSAEWWLHQNKPNYGILHNSGLNHYQSVYPRSNYDWINSIVSAWKGHRDFAEWLIGYKSPETIVELGVDFGFSTFVFANALKTGKVYGIDLFLGDVCSGYRNTLPFVTNLIKEKKIKNLEIIVGDFTAVSETWKTPIDILHIDGLHTYSAVKSDFTNWYPFVKKDGVVLFHDVVAYKDTVGKFFNELGGYKLYFTHSAGLGIYTENKELYTTLKEKYNFYHFTNNWFECSELKRVMSQFVKLVKVKILEIGSHEGASAVFFSDHFLDDPESTLVCVDPFNTSDTTTPVNETTKRVFMENLKLSKNNDKVKNYFGYSNDFFKENNETFTFIYIDGSHLIPDVTMDLLNSVKVILPGGIIWMDDYHPIKEHIDKINMDGFEIIHQGYQIAFRKLKG